MFHTAGLCLRGADHAATCIMHEKCSPNVDQFERNNTEKQYNRSKISCRTGSSWGISCKTLKIMEIRGRYLANRYLPRFFSTHSTYKTSTP